MASGFTAQFLGLLLAFVTGTTFARYCQAFVASLLGDRLPRREGRISLNPARQHEALPLLLALFYAFGRPTVAWGKPLNLDPFANRLKRAGGSIIAITGPLAYILLALLARLLLLAFPNNAIETNFLAAVIYRFVEGSLIYAAFNCLPLPPLDAWNFIKGLWPPAWDLKVGWVEKYGTVLLLFLTLILPTFNPQLNLFENYYFTPIVDIFLRLFGLPVV